MKRKTIKRRAVQAVLLPLLLVCLVGLLIVDGLASALNEKGGLVREMLSKLR